MSFDPAPRISPRLAAATRGAWRLQSAWRDGASWIVVCDTGAGQLEIEVRRADSSTPAYKTLGDRAYAYRVGQTQVPRERTRFLDAAIQVIDGTFAEAVGDPFAINTPREAKFPSPRHSAHLDQDALLTEEQRIAFRCDGHVLVRNAFDREVLLALRPQVLVALRREWPRENARTTPASAYTRAFSQIVNLGLREEAVRCLV